MQNLKKGKDGVVSVFDPKDFEIVWKKVPGYPWTEVSNIGTVRKINVKGKITDCALNKSKTSVGYYFAARVLNEDLEYCFVGVHRLVALAFHGLPPEDGLLYEPNHKDGNKHNNLPSNLEWMTRSENCIHALKNNLRRDNLIVLVKDLESQTTTEYYSISEFARDWDIPRNDAKRLISRHQMNPYQGRWLFCLSKSEKRGVVRKSFNAVKAYDHVEGQELVASSASQMAFQTGIHQTTISVRIKGDSAPTTKTLGGYEFKAISDNTPWEPVDPAIAKQEREAYFNRKPVGWNRTGVVVKDYTTGEIRTYANYKEVVIGEGIVYGTLTDLIRNNETLKLTKGKVYKRSDDTREFPEFSELDVKKSLMGIKPQSKVLRLTDTVLNTTQLFYSAKELAVSLGMNNVAKVSMGAIQSRLNTLPQYHLEVL